MTIELVENTEAQPQADGDATPPTALSLVALAAATPEEQLTLTLSRTDMQAFLLFSIAGFATMTAGYRAVAQELDAIEGAFNHVYDEAGIIGLVDGPMGDAVNNAFGEGTANSSVDDLLRIFTAE